MTSKCNTIMILGVLKYIHEHIQNERNHHT